jgi:hypothetical protein
MNGNFKVRCVESYKDWTTVGKIYSVVNGIFTYNNGHPEAHKYYSVEEMNKNFISQFELVAETVPTTESISIYRKNSRVIATITNGERKYSRSVSINKAGDFKTAVKMVVELLMDKFDGFAVREVEAVNNDVVNAIAQGFHDAVKAIFPPAFDWDGFKQGKFAVHCDTEEKAREFLKECEARNIKWAFGDKPTAWNISDCTNKTYDCKNSVLTWSFKKDTDNFIEYTPSTPTVKEVHRPAKVGEWIKVTNPNDEEPYSIGDIFVVCVEVPCFDAVYAKIDNVGNVHSYGYHYIYTKEYVVLENYQPPIDSKLEEPKPSEDAKPFVKAKVGDKIEIVKAIDGHGPEVNNGDVQTVIRVQYDGIVTDVRNVFYDHNQEYIILEPSTQPECSLCHSTNNLLTVDGAKVCRVCSHKVIKAYMDGEM